MTDSAHQTAAPTKPDASVSVGFAALGLSPAIVKAVTALGYEEATPIQREAIAVLRSGRDLTLAVTLSGNLRISQLRRYRNTTASPPCRVRRRAGRR